MKEKHYLVFYCRKCYFQDELARKNTLFFGKLYEMGMEESFWIQLSGKFGGLNGWFRSEEKSNDYAFETGINKN
jgi:hypothetical protein